MGVGAARALTGGVASPRWAPPPQGLEPPTPSPAVQTVIGTMQRENGATLGGFFGFSFG